MVSWIEIELRLWLQRTGDFYLLFFMIVGHRGLGVGVALGLVGGRGYLLRIACGSLVQNSHCDTLFIIATVTL